MNEPVFFSDAEKERMRLEDAVSDRDATIAELRAEVDTLAKAWRKAEDENDELRAEVECLTDAKVRP